MEKLSNKLGNFKIPRNRHPFHNKKKHDMFLFIIKSLI